jgi:hypothetical protein
VRKTSVSSLVSRADPHNPPTVHLIKRLGVSAIRYFTNEQFFQTLADQDQWVQPQFAAAASSDDADVVLEGGDGDDDDDTLPVPADLQIKADKVISQAFLAAKDEDFVAIAALIIDENLPIDYKVRRSLDGKCTRPNSKRRILPLHFLSFQHSRTGVTPLMTASSHGNVSMLEQLLAFGADLDVRAANGWNARDFAVCRKKQEAVNILESYRLSVRAGALVVDAFEHEEAAIGQQASCS